MKRIFAHIGFSCALSLIAVNLIPFNFILTLLVGMCILFAASVIIKKYRQALCVPVCLASAIFSILVFMCYYKGSVEPCLMLDGQSSETVLYITSLAQKTTNGYAYTAKTLSIDTQGAVQNINVRLISDELLNVKPYRIIKANLKFFATGESAFSSFGYWSKNIYLYASFDDLSFTNMRVKSIFEPLLNLRADIISTITSNVKSDAGALSAALLTGDKSGLSDNTNSLFKASGASHLMAVSGLHLSVSVGFAVLAMKKLRFNSKIVFLISFVLVFCYSAVAGFSKSIVRAGIMMIVMLLGEAVGKRSDTLNSLGFSIFIICLNPFAVTDIGISLSALAVLAICTLYPVFAKFTAKLNNMYDKTAVKFIKSVVVYILNAFFLSLAITIFTLPVMYIYFGYVSIAGLISNIVLSPLGSLSLKVSFLSYFFSSTMMSEMMFELSDFLCSAMIYLVKKFAQMRFSTVHLDASFALVIAGVLIVISFCFFVCNKQLMKKAGAICGAIVIAFIGVSAVINSSYNTLYVCSNSSVVICCENRVIVCYADDKDFSSIDSFAASHSRKIDYMFIENKNCEKAVELSNKYNCNEITSVCFDEAYLSGSNAKSIVVASENKIVAENIIFSYNCIGNVPYYILESSGATVLIGNAQSNDCDIIISENSVTDINGVIDLSKGNVEYTLSSKNTFYVRRDRAWQD